MDANLLKGSTPPFRDTAVAIFCMSKPYCTIIIHRPQKYVNSFHEKRRRDVNTEIKDGILTFDELLEDEYYSSEFEKAAE